MTDFTNYRSRTRDIQDGTERGVWGRRTEITGAGSIMSVRGTGTVDEELPIINFGYSFNLDDDSDAEVIMLSMGSDVDNKVALPTLPRDKQHPWAPGTGGMQHPTDPGRRIEFNGDETWLKDGRFVLGDDKPVVVTITGNDVSIEMAGDHTLNIQGDSTVNVQGNATVSAAGTMDLVSGGDLSLSAPNVAINSGGFTHNGTNVGDSHVHSGVTVGLADTQGPN